jgi:CRISPR/Cas system-associated exonuclease Cas4 (RecB family)
MKRLYISQSAIRDFLTCKKRYYYRLNFKKESVPTQEMFLGTLVHKLLEDFSDDHAGALEEVIRLKKVHSLSVKDGSVLSSSIQGFFDSFQHLITPDDETEKMFSVPYEKDVYLTGKFDRITPNHMIIDWKSGTYVPLTLANDVQSIIYNYAYEKLYGVTPNVVVAYLRKNKMSTYLENEIYVDTLLNNVIPDMLESIYREEFPRTGYFTNGCHRCSFREFCDKEAGR